VLSAIVTGRNSRARDIYGWGQRLTPRRHTLFVSRWCCERDRSRSFVFNCPPSYNESRGTLQYLTTIADSAAHAFFGNRYVMADLQQRTLGLDTRASVTFSPAMTLEVYVQPFFAAGQ
jgi:hypothetical protein